MTREEAIKELRLIAKITMWNDRREAVEMAIEALSETSGDLISRQDAVNTIKRYKHRLEGRGQTYGFLLEEFEHRIPSAEAVEVVRCKDCKYWHGNTEFCDMWSHLNIAQRTLADDYCSLGERKGGEDE